MEASKQQSSQCKELSQRLLCKRPGKSSKRLNRCSLEVTNFPFGVFASKKQNCAEGLLRLFISNIFGQFNFYPIQVHDFYFFTIIIKQQTDKHTKQHPPSNVQHNLPVVCVAYAWYCSVFSQTHRIFKRCTYFREMIQNSTNEYHNFV